MLAVTTEENLFIQTSKTWFEWLQIGFSGEKTPKNTKQSLVSLLFFNQRVCQSLFDHITLISHSCGWLLVKCRCCFWLPIISLLHKLSGCHKSGIHSESAPDWPLEFSHVLEELPVDISCSFLNQLKGPQDVGHTTSGTDTCGKFVAQREPPLLMTTGHNFALEGIIPSQHSIHVAHLMNTSISHGTWL